MLNEVLSGSKCKALAKRCGVGRGQKSLPCDAGPEIRGGEDIREKAKINGMGKNREKQWQLYLVDRTMHGVLNY